MITANPLTTSGDPTSKSTYTTASISPGANRLVLAVVTHTQAAATAPVPTLSGAGLTWVQVATVIDAGNVRRATIFRAMSASPTPSAVTIDFGGSAQTRCEWSISEFNGAITTGSNGADAIVQAVTKIMTAPSTGMDITLAAFAAANNAAFAGLRIGNATAVVAGSGMTELGQFNQTSGVQAEWKATSQTTVGWTWPSASSIYLGIAVEIAYDPSIIVPPHNMTLLGIG